MDLKTAVEHIRPSVCQLRAYDGPPPGTQSVIVGSAFIVDDEYLVTANHVIDKAAPLVGDDGAFRAFLAFPNVETPDGPVRGTFSGVTVEVAAVDSDNDLALLQGRFPEGDLHRAGGVDLTTAATPVSLDTTRPIDGEMVAISGYPLSIPALVSNAGFVASSWAVDDARRNDRYLCDIATNPGNSGAPAYRLSDGKVIGLCSGSLIVPGDGGPYPATGLTTVIPATYVGELLATRIPRQGS